MAKYQKESWGYRRLEKKVPKYTLPSLLQMEDGTPVTIASQWVEKRRPEIFNLFQEHVYGRVPSAPTKVYFKEITPPSDAIGGKAIQKEIELSLTGEVSGPTMDVLIFLPKSSEKPVPIFLTLNFFGNQTIHPDPNISLHSSWVANKADFGISENQATEESRGVRKERWPLEYIIDHGYGLAAIYYGDIVPDHKQGLENGLPGHFGLASDDDRSGDAWGAISAWAWGLSRSLDYFEQDDDVDEKKVAVLGHSRLGKTSLWAGASDQRFALVISNDSGCGGAALSRRHFGETVDKINRSFPHWFCRNFRRYNEKEKKLPVDQHQLISLIAPRPVYVASANQDLWADPVGEYLSLRYASPVYELLGKPGFQGPDMPDLESPIKGIMGHHVRKGTHNLLLYDWIQYIKFADMHFRPDTTQK